MSLVVSLNDFRLAISKLRQLNMPAVSNSASTEKIPFTPETGTSVFKVHLHCLNHCKEYSGIYSSFLDTTTDRLCVSALYINIKGSKNILVSSLVQKTGINI